MSRTSPYTRLIHRCLLGDGLADAAELIEAAAAVTNWDELLELAAQHRVTAYVQEGAARCGLELPAEAARRLRELTLLARARALLIDRLLAQVAGALAEHEVPLIVLKGPALARTIYPQPALRTYDDLDLLVPARDECRALEALAASGLQQLPDAAEDAWLARAGAVRGGAPFHRRLAPPGLPVLVELHVDPLQLGLAPACEADRWRRSRPLVGFTGVRLLGPEDQVVQLSVHAHKHGYSRLIWLKDIDLLLTVEHGSIDWALVAQVAKREGVSAAVWYTLELVEAIFCTPVPPAAIRSLRPSPIVRALYRRIWPAQGVIEMRGRMHRRAVQFRPADAWRGSIPSLVLMGRRRARARAGLSATARRLTLRSNRRS